MSEQSNTNCGIADFLNHPAAYVGRVTFICRLLVDGDKNCWLADNYQEFQQGRRTPLPASRQIVDALYKDVPALGGGSVVFNEDCKATVDILAGQIRSFTRCEVQGEGFHTIIYG